MTRKVKTALLAAAMFFGTGAALADLNPGPGGSAGYPHRIISDDGPGLGGGYAIARDGDGPGLGGGYAIDRDGDGPGLGGGY